VTTQVSVGRTACPVGGVYRRLEDEFFWIKAIVSRLKANQVCPVPDGKLPRIMNANALQCIGGQHGQEIKKIELWVSLCEQTDFMLIIQTRVGGDAVGAQRYLDPQFLVLLERKMWVSKEIK